VNPNPSNGNIRLSLPGSLTSNLKVELFNVLGDLVYNNSFDKSGGTKVPLQFSNLPKGIYLLKVLDGRVVYEEKVILN